MRTSTTVLSALVFLLAAPVAIDAIAATSKKAAPPVSLMKPDESSAVVSFIRRSVLLGDGWNYDVWDGDEYVGVLGAGQLLQYRANPGEHLFLLMGRGTHAWAFMKADLIAGKEYFARAYPIPFALQPTNAHTDERVSEWLTMNVSKKLTEKQKAKVTAKNLEEARAAIAAFTGGDVPMNCALWLAPRKDGKPRKQLERSDGCRSVGDMKPEFGR